MIELTEQQSHDLAQGGLEPLRVIDPMTQRNSILLRSDVIERMKGLLYDDSPWTDEEMDLLAVEAGEMLDKFGRDR